MEVSSWKTDVTEEGTAENLDMPCEICQIDNVNSKANGVCRECDQCICNACFKQHLKAKSCRHHVLVDTDQTLTPSKQSRAENVEKCKRHRNETIKYYCKKHDVVGCGDCMIPGHSTCKAENIKNLSKEFQLNKDFKSLMIKFENILSANKDVETNLRARKKANTDMIGKVMKEIKSFRTEINNYLDKAESNIINEIVDIEFNHRKLVTKLEQDCERVNSKISEIREKLDTELYQDSALFIQTVDCRPKITDIEIEVARIQRETDIRTFEFIPDRQLYDMSISIPKIGRLRKNENLSLRKLDTARPTTGRGFFSGRMNQTEYAFERNEIGQVPGKRVAGSARVRQEWGFYGGHEGRPGTATAVNSNRAVNVMCDAKGQDTGKRIAVGARVRPVWAYFGKLVPLNYYVSNILLKTVLGMLDE